MALQAGPAFSVLLSSSAQQHRHAGQAVSAAPLSALEEPQQQTSFDSPWRGLSCNVAGTVLAVSGVARAAALRRSRRNTQGRMRSSMRSGRTQVTPAGIASAPIPNTLEGETAVKEAVDDIATAAQDVSTPHWSDNPMKTRKPKMKLNQMIWKDAHGAACILSAVLFMFALARFIAGEPPSDIECYVSGICYAIIYASRFSSIRSLEPHFRVTFYATTGWTVYYIAHLLAATCPVIFAHSIYPTGIIFVASTIYFYAHWLGRMWRHFVEDRFRPYYVPGLAGLMYFHGLDCIDLMNQWLDPNYWDNIIIPLPDQAWTIKDVRITGLFMSSAALFMITLHNKGVLTGGQNTLITVLFTIFVPALILAGTHADLQASFP